MAKFDIYAGLGGGFGGAHFHLTDEFDSEEEAVEYAHYLAVEEYKSYEGCNGILSWEDCKQDLIESYGSIDYDEEVDDYYLHEIEAWIEYWADPHFDNTSIY